jgi:hypothetical protein
LGVPVAAATPLATLVPAAELLTGLALVPGAFARAGAMAALALLALFTTVSALNLWRGRTVDCGCFGSVAPEPLGPAMVARNLVLMALAGLVIAFDSSTAGAASAAWAAMPLDLRALALGSIALLFALALVDVHASRLRTAHARLQARLAALEHETRSSPAEPLAGAAGLAVGTSAPTFDLPKLEGDRASLAGLVGRGRPVALIFLSAHCPSCHELWPDIERWQASPGAPEVAAVCGGSAQTFELKLMGYNVTNVLLEGDTRTAEAYAVTLRPSAVIVGTDGTIVSPSAVGTTAIRALLRDLA